MDIDNKFDNQLQFLNYQNIFRFVNTIIVGLFFTQLETITKYNLPLIRYSIYALALYFFFKGIKSTYSSKNYNGIIVKSLIVLLYLSVIYSIVIALPTIFSPAHNFIILKRALSGELLLFLFPLILLINPNLEIWERLLSLSFKLAFIFLLFTIPLFLYFVTMPKLGAEGYIRNFASGSTIIFLTLFYHSKRVNFIVIVTYILSLLSMVLLARRNQILYLVMVLLLLVFTTFFTSGSQIKKSRSNIAFGLLFAISFIPFIFLTNLDFSKAEERFSITTNKGINYSREAVLHDFKTSFNKKPIDWWLGRGIFGTYQSSTVSQIEKNMLGYGKRSGIENGYYNHILKGGLFYLIPFVLLSLIGFNRGMFRSNNMLSKAAAAIVLINLVDLIGFGLPDLNLKYLILWFSLALCYSTTIRNYTDDYIKEMIGLK